MIAATVACAQTIPPGVGIYNLAGGSGTGGGVTSIIAGTGISVNQATGAVTVTNTGAGSGDMLLAGVQTVTGAKTFGTTGGAVGKLILAGSTSGTTIFNAAAVAGAGTWTLQTGSDTVVGLATADTFTGIKTFNAGKLQLQLAANPSFVEGLVFYDTTEKALSYFNDTSGVTVNVGQEQLVRVINNSGSTIGTGLAVYASGAGTGLPQITLGANTAEASSRIIGVTTSSMTNGSIGYVTQSGVVHSLNTSAFTLGATVYLNTSGGTLTATQPSGSNYIVPVGVVRVSNVSTGELLVTPLGYRLASATITGADTQVVFFDGANAPAGDAGFTYNKTTDSATLVGTMTAASFVGSGTTPAAVSLIAGTGSIPALTANSAGFAAPATGGTAWLGKLPATITAGIATFGTPGTVDGVNESAITSTATTGTGNVVLSASPTLTGTIGAASLTLSSLTSGRATYAGASGLLSDEAAYAYNAATNILTVGGISLGAGSEVSSIGPLVDSVDGTTPLNNINQVVATGTVYTLTTSFASVAFGTTSPVLTLANAGTYSIYVDVQTSLVSATTTTQSVSYKLRRTNNTAADLTGSQFGDPLPVATVGSPLGPSTHIGPIKYTTALTTDTLTVQGAISGALGAGTATVSACTITAIRAY